MSPTNIDNIMSLQNLVYIYINILINQYFDPLHSFIQYCISLRKKQISINYQNKISSIRNVIYKIRFHNQIIINYFINNMMAGNNKVLSLTENGLNRLITDKNSNDVIVQVVGFTNSKKKTQTDEIFYGYVSDGRYKIKTFWDSNCDVKINKFGTNFDNQIIRILRYGATQKNILIYEYEIVYEGYNGVIGNPVMYSSASMEENNNVSNIIDPSKLKKQEEKIIVPTKNFSGPIIKTENNTQNKSALGRLAVKNSVDFQQISDLYPNLDNWRIFCRIIKKTYSEFQNKKKTMTKLLNLELMDRKENIIKAAIFGDFAQKMNNQLQLDQVYIFSQGHVKIDTYTNKKAQNLSQYTINFTEHSKIMLTTDDKSVKTSKNSNLYSELNEIKIKRPNQQVDIVAIIKEIKDEVNINSKNSRDSTPLKKRTIVVCDPIAKVQIDVVFWNTLTNINMNLKNKTVALCEFKIHQYSDARSLNASFKSQIIPLTDHEFCKYEKDVQNIECESLSYRRGEGETKTPKNIKEMQMQKDDIKQNGQLWSDFRVYLNKIKQKVQKKWYIGCPYCKKSVQDGQTTCSDQKCKKSFDRPKARYILQVQLSDYSGSIWTTAYDEFAQKFFKYVGDYPADIAKTMSQAQFSQLCKKSMFQEFKMKVITKYDLSQGNRRIKHNIAKLLPLDYATEAKLNLQKIRLMI